MINIILSVVYYKNKLAIGRDDKLLFRFQHDMDFFREMTIGNIIVMGYNTYLSIGKQPLKGRINIILTSKTELYNNQRDNFEFDREYFMSYEMFMEIYNSYKPVVFVIGGSKIYYLFIEKATFVYLTDIKTNNEKEIKFELENEPNIFLNYFPNKFKLKTVSSKIFSKNKLYSYRFLKYEKTELESSEVQYTNLLKNILTNGNTRSDRTQTGTVSIFGTQLRFNISETIPLMTLKQVPFRIILEELLWFCRGDTDAKILQRKGIYIWNGNTSREFLDSQGLNHYEEGVLGAGYGFQWRHQGAEYKQEYADTSKVQENIGGFDQLEYIENLLKTDPFSRRIVLSAWNPSDFNKTSLVPCHILLQFYVEEINDEKHLSCQFYMRSNDVFLANVFNVVSYSILTYILALKCDMKPKEIIYTCGDSHIYLNHLEQVNKILERDMRPLPKLILNDSLKYKDWKQMEETDFELIGYFPHSPVKAVMAI